MDVAWADERTKAFVTNVGLITSTGPNGNDIMSAEWTHHVSYAPFLIAVAIGRGKATSENILESKEFGVSIAALDQNVLSSVAGRHSGHDVDKVALLKELGFEFYEGKKIKAPMVKGAAMNAECKLIQVVDIGDHPLFIGEVVELSHSAKEPLLYQPGKYWRLGENLAQPPQEFLDKIAKLAEKHARK